MARLKNIIISIITFAIVGLSLYGIFLLLRPVASEINTLNPNVIASLIAALTAVFGYLYNQRKSKLRDIAETHRLQKVELYKSFMDMTVNILMKTKTGELNELPDGQIPSDLEKQFMHFTRDLISWGSPEVIKTFKKFRDSSEHGPNPQVIVLVDDILHAMRKDLGHSNFGLRRGDLIKLFIKDPHEVDKLLQGSQ